MLKRRKTEQINSCSDQNEDEKIQVDILIDDAFTTELKPGHSQFFAKVQKMIQTLNNLSHEEIELD